VAGGPGWLSKDPIGLGGGDVNLYRYVRNRPLVAVDPSGLAASRPQCGPAPRKPDINEFWRCFRDLMDPSHDWNPMAPNACRSCKARTGVNVDCDSRFFFWAWPVHVGPLRPPRPPRPRRRLPDLPPADLPPSDLPKVVAAFAGVPRGQEGCKGNLIGPICGGLFPTDPTICQACVHVECHQRCRGMHPDFERECILVGYSICDGTIITRESPSGS
jgi:hypothetical protein